MASITIRNLDDDVKRRLRVRAAEHGRSMEEEARDILRQVVGQPNEPRNLGLAIHSRLESTMMTRTMTTKVSHHRTLKNQLWNEEKKFFQNVIA